MAKFLSNALFKGSLTVDNGITLTGGKNITTINQLYVLASNYANGIAVGYDTAAVYLGYSMGTVPIHIGSNGSGNLVVRTTGNTVIENGSLLVGTSTNSGYKADIVGTVRATGNGYYVNNGATTAPVITFSGSNKVSVDPQGYGTVMNATLQVANQLSVGSYITSTGYHVVKGGTTAVDTPFISYGIGRPEFDHSLQPLAGMGGYYAGAGWYNGAGLIFYTSVGSDISGGSNLAEVMRLTPAGVLSVSNLSGAGTRMVVASSTGQLSTQSIPTGTVLGTGTANYTARWTNSTTLAAGSIFDDGTSVAIGTATVNAQTRLTVMGSQTYSKSIVLDSTWNYQTSWAMKNGVYSTEFNLGGSTKATNEGGPGSLQISTYNSSTSTYRYPITFFANANVAFGGTSGTVPTDNGSTVQVNGSASISGLAGTGSRMVVASSTGVLSTQAIPSATGLQTAVDTDKTTSASLAVGTTAVKSVSASTYTGVFFDYVVKNGTNVRVGSVVAITNGTQVEYYETLSNDLGSTTGITFSVDLNAGNIRLRATTTATGWTAIVSTRGI